MGSLIVSYEDDMNMKTEGFSINLLLCSLYGQGVLFTDMRVKRTCGTLKDGTSMTIDILSLILVNRHYFIT